MPFGILESRKSEAVPGTGTFDPKCEVKMR